MQSVPTFTVQVDITKLIQWTGEHVLYKYFMGGTCPPYFQDDLDYYLFLQYAKLYRFDVLNIQACRFNYS